jgi:hypothetical protein
MIFISHFCQVDKKYDFYFCHMNKFPQQVIPLRCQIETDTGSAGEQPVRDKFDEHK